MAGRGRLTMYQKGMPKALLELMSVGASRVEVCAQFGITVETFKSWINPGGGKRYQIDLHEAYDLGLVKGQAWWEAQGRENLNSASFKTDLWFKNIKNRYKDEWKDKHEVKLEAGGDLAADILAARGRVKDG